MTINVKPRKLQELGKFSLYLNMPRTWVQHHNLKKGAPIFIEIDDEANLILRVKNEIKQTC